MTELMKQLSARKVERRRQLAALPVGDKLRMLEEMVAATKVIGATRPPKPANPVRLRESVVVREGFGSVPGRCDWLLPGEAGSRAPPSAG